MTIIQLTACENGAHANQMKSGVFRRIPAGWAAVPDALETAAKAYLPWVTLTVEDGVITGITENTAGRAAWEAALAAQAEITEGGEG